jgi:hypothetical protein
MTLTSVPIYRLQGLGLVATGRRSIRSGSEYNRYFDMSGLVGTDPIIAGPKSDNYDTLREMTSMSKEFTYQTEKISNKLKGSSLEETLRNIWSFLYNHVQYKLDSKTREQLRTPLRTWKDRSSGVDCDCFSVFASTVLRNLGISHAFRMTKYNAGFQHVYVVVPKDGKKESLDIPGKYFIIDPVVDRFNYEVPFSDKHDRYMYIQQLNGLGGVDHCKPNSQQYQYYERAAQFREKGLLLTDEFLTENKIPFKQVEEPVFGYQVAIGKSQLVIKPVITKEQGAGILQAIKNGEPVSSCACDEAKERKNMVTWLLWLFGISTAIIVLE